MNIYDDDEKVALYGKAGGTRQIQDTSITRSEIDRLIAGGHKLDSSTVNALCAKAQFDAEQSNTTESCILSSWLGPLVKGKVKEGVVYKTVHEHALNAVPDRQVYSLRARTKWIIPLCSFTKPAHWVLAWIDFGAKRIEFFDSIPEMASTSWAEPLLLKIVDKIFVAIEEPSIVWDDGQWKRILHSPAVLERQLDGWSCGLFVFMAAVALLNGQNMNGSVGRSGLKVARKNAVEALLDLTIIRPARSADSVPYAVGEVEVTVELGPIPAISISKTEDLREEEAQTATDQASLQLDSGSCRVEVGGSGTQEEGSGGGGGGSEEESGPSPLPQKRPRESGNEISASNQENRVPKAMKMAASVTKPARKAEMSSSQREQVLEDDKWVKTYDKRTVECKGCQKSIKLSAQEKRAYELKNWNDHKDSCSHITGQILLRTRIAPPKVYKAGQPGQSGISSFFGVASTQHSRDLLVDSDTGAPLQLGLISDSTKASVPIPAPTRYKIRAVNSTPSITGFFARSALDRNGDNKTEKITAPASLTVQCEHLKGPTYEDYIALTNTRGFGGIGFVHIARAARQLFPYKTFPPMKDKSNGTILNLDISPGTGEAPKDGNLEAERKKWTSAEMHRLEMALTPWVRWEVNYTHRYVKSSLCDGSTINVNSVCDQCLDLASDESFKRSLRRKNEEASKPQEERLKMLASRQKYTKSDGVKLIDQNAFREKLQDPVLFRLHDALKTGGPEDCYLSLFESARLGEMKNHQQFLNISEVFADRLQRENSGNPNSKFGIRYKADYMQFMTVLRGYGQNSNRQFEIISAALFAPSSRQIKTLSARSSDSLRNPALIFENVARLKRYVDSIGYTGPIISASDATKVRKHLNYSTEFGAHVLGSIFDLSEVEVDNAKDIDDIVERTAKEKAFATQARAIIAKVPLPGSPPIVIALLPTNGTETADMIHLQHLQLQLMAAQLKLPLVALAADGAASELAAQFMTDSVQIEGSKPLVYDYPLYGIHLRAPVFEDTGPLISVTDAPHARKTARNQPQYGTHTASLGVGHLVNHSLVDLYETKAAGLVVRDVANVDKQDDGAARRVFHHQALEACTMFNKANKVSIRSGFEGVFTYLFVLGQLFEAWMSPSMSTHERVLAALRARFWLHYWRQHVLGLCERFPDLYSMSRSFISSASFHIFNRLCDTLILLALAYAEFYPDQAFCIWLIATDFVEHFFGISRQLLPNFSYAEFLKIAQHVMVRQRILQSGLIKFKRETKSAVGYIYNEDLDMRKKVVNGVPLSCSVLSRSDLNALVEIAHDEAARICRELLFIPVPQIRRDRPVVLVSLGAAAAKRSKGKKANEKGCSNDEYASDIEDDEESDGDNDDEEEVCIGLEEAIPAVVPTVSIGDATAVAAHETAEYSAICQDLDKIVDEARLTDRDLALPLPSSFNKPSESPAPNLSTSPIQRKSKLVDDSSKIVVQLLLDNRKSLQSGTVTKSERVVVVSKKYTGAVHEKISAGGGKEIRLKVDEAAHRLRIAQETNTKLKRDEANKTRQVRWQSMEKQIEKDLRAKRQALPHLSEKNVTALNELKRHSFLIMRTSKRFYIGEVLDIYKKGQSSRYGSIERSSTLQGLSWLSLRVFLELGVGEINTSDESDQSITDDDEESEAPNNEMMPDFSCIGGTRAKYHLHTHAPVDNILYHLGPKALTGHHNKMSLIPAAAAYWAALNTRKTKSTVSKGHPALKIRIPPASERA